MPYEALTKERLTRAPPRLSELAAAEGIVLEIDLYGGAVFTLVYGSRDSTRDVDAVIKPPAQGARLVRKVATEQDLPEDWLNSEVQQFLSPHGQNRPFPAPELEPGIILSVPTANYLLALKLRASRPPLLGYPGDEPDIRYLLHKIKPASLETVDAIFERFFPGDALHDYARSMVTRLLTEIPRTP